MQVLVIGGGAVGAATALFLKREGGAHCEVTVVEPDPGLRLASSARSAASIRQQFSQAVNVQLSRFGFEVISQPQAWLAVDGVAPALGLVQSPYLFLATSAGGAQVMQANRQLQQREGAAVRALSPADAAARLPWLHTGDLQAATLGQGGEGWFDGEAYARALGAKARALGAQWLRGQVVGAQRDGPRLSAVALSDGRHLAAQAVVLAAGAWSGQVGAALGLPVPVRARRRTVFSLRCPHPLGDGALPTPLVVDPSGVWFRSEGSGFIAGWSPQGTDPDPDDLPLDQPDLQQFDDRVWPALAHRVPAFEALRVHSAWDGYYEVHPLDHNALLGPHPQCPNLLLACGFSGHGLQHAAGAGRGIAEWLLHGGWRSIDLSGLSPQRLADGRAFVEQAII